MTTPPPSSPTSPRSSPSGLHERRRRQTRSEISAAAVALFTEQGYDNTTVEDVAAAAGVSRRTAYRHFPSKEDLVFVHGLVWLEVFDEIRAERRPEDSTQALIHRGVFAVADTIDSSRKPLLAAWNVAQGNDTLRSRLGRFQDEWMQRYVELIAADTSHREDGLLDAAIVAGTLVGTTNALVGLWAMQGATPKMHDLTQSVLVRVEPLWPSECLSPPT